MEQMEHELKRGFNNGYLIARYLPELSQMMIKNLEPANDYLNGMIQCEKEFSS